MLNAVRSGTDFQEIVSAKNGELRNPGKIRRDNEEVEAAVVAAAFRLPHPQDGTPSTGEAQLDNGGRAVLLLSAVDTPEDARLNEVQQRRLRDLAAGAQFGAYMEEIETRVGVEIRERPDDAETPPIDG